MPDNTKFDLLEIAKRSMLERGFKVEFPPEVLAQAEVATEPDFSKISERDMTNLLWSSIDNDDSKDLDQIEYSEPWAGGVTIYVAIADVSLFIPKGSAADLFAQHNTTSVYTGVEVFPMLPKRFSTDLTSLNENQKRLAVVIEMKIDNNGVVKASSVYHAIVINKAQLTYDGVSAWLEKKPGPFSGMSAQTIAKINRDPDLQKQIIQQDEMAQKLRDRRRAAGALDFQSNQLQPVLGPDGKIELIERPSLRASRVIEEFMVAANESVDNYLESKNNPCFQRVVRTPKNWDRIVALAAEHGAKLPVEPNGQALQKFLAQRRSADPENFGDLSLAMIKLLGRGEYVVKRVGQRGLGHFGLAASNYAHTTAPNRRYPDLITQRLLHFAVKGGNRSYSIFELDNLAVHCTQKEDDANRVERRITKCMAAVSLSSRIGETFTGIITGASDKGVFVRVSHPPVEGKVQGDTQHLEVGEHVEVKLVQTDPILGFIDFMFLKKA